MMAQLLQTLMVKPNMEKVTLRVKLSGGFRFRMWLAARLIVMAGAIAGCQVDVDID